MTFGSLFAGIGGIDLGLERAGLQCRWQVEIDPFCRKVLEKHWPHVKRYEDITKTQGSDLEPVDLLAGGFPCQDLSQAGKRAGIEGSRSGLWFEFARLIGELRPRYVLIENVPGLLVYDGMRRVLGELSRHGYDATWFSKRASDFGASHLRKRVFIVAHRNTEYDHGSRDAGTGRRRESANDRIELAYREGGGRRELRQPSGSDGLIDGSNAHMADAERSRRDRSKGRADVPNPGCHGFREEGRHMEYAINGRPQERWTESAGTVRNVGNEEFGSTITESGRRLDFAPGPSDPRWPAILAERPDLAPAIESPLRGMADGVPSGLDRAMSNRTKRLSRLGNAVVPQIAEWIGRRLLREAETSLAALKSELSIAEDRIKESGFARSQTAPEPPSTQETP